MARQFSIPPDQLARQKMLEAQEAAQKPADKRPSHESKAPDSSSRVSPQRTDSERAASQSSQDD